MTTIISLAKQMLAAMEVRTRDDGTRFWAFKDPEGVFLSESNWMRDIMYAAHGKGNRLPNDANYEVVVDVLQALAELDCAAPELEAIERVREALDPDVYDHQLTAWLNADAGNVEYLTVAIRDYRANHGHGALRLAQELWKRDIGHAVFYGLKKRVEELNGRKEAANEV